tara:strand:+ start:62 stop:721 length:660 start_codon:yes stop_codon:yes gene_type:complete
MNIGITNINDLPNNNNSNEFVNQNQIQAHQQSQNQNISISQNQVLSQNNNSLENPNIYNPNISNQKNQENQNIYNEMIGQIQQMTTSNNNIDIPSRDIPNNPNNIVQDSTTKPNYIPNSKSHEDYIKNFETPQSVIEKKNQDIRYENNIEYFYNEIQIPILLALVYFIFNIPYSKKILLKYIPKLFTSDGNYNIYGNIATSLFFAIIYYTLIKLIDYIK